MNIEIKEKSPNNNIKENYPFIAKYYGDYDDPALLIILKSAANETFYDAIMIDKNIGWDSFEYRCLFVKSKCVPFNGEIILKND